MQDVLDGVIAQGAAGVLLVCRDARGEWRGASGIAEFETERPVDPAGWFRAGSVTKTFTSAVMLSLAADGALDLEDSCERWLPGVVPAGEGITVRQLLNHTSGLYNYTNAMTDAAAVLRDRYVHWNPERALRMAFENMSLFEPGADWSYSNTNYTVAGLIIEAVTGSTWGAEVMKRIVEPLDLRHTIVPGDYSGLPEPHAHGYMAIGDEVVDVTEFNVSQAWCSGSLISTADDLNRFYAMLLAGELLPAPQLGEMLTAIPNGENGRGYGLGIARRRLSDGTLVWGHNGGIFGFVTSSFHAVDGSRQFTASYTTAGEESFNPDDFVALVLDRLPDVEI